MLCEACPILQLLNPCCPRVVLIHLSTYTSLHFFLLRLCIAQTVCSTNFCLKSIYTNKSFARRLHSSSVGLLVRVLFRVISGLFYRVIFRDKTWFVDKIESPGDRVVLNSCSALPPVVGQSRYVVWCELINNVNTPDFTESKSCSVNRTVRTNVLKSCSLYEPLHVKASPRIRGRGDNFRARPTSTSDNLRQFSVLAANCHAQSYTWSFTTIYSATF